jgi:hypothetical protein
MAEEEQAAPSQELTINLKDPVFTHGVITTDKGGIIESESMRIQARKMEYTNRIENGNPVKKIVAEGDLLMEYGGRAFVGRKLEYDFVTKTGTMWDGRTSTDYWFVGGDEIELQPDGSFLITNAFITTVEGQDNWWELRSSHIDVSPKNLLSAKNIKFRFFKVPVFWLPSFKMNLKWIKDSPLKYKFLWDQVLKQKISMRYQVYSTETFGLYGRFDYRFKFGPGAAIETDYHSLDQRTLFQTKSYGAFDKIIPQERGDKRFRLQGIYTTHSRNEKTHVHMTYDRMSDDKMPQEFKHDDFELNTQKRTIFWVTHYEDNTFSRFNLQPRINGFQSINQQLPYVMTTIRPFQLGSSGIIMENWFSAGYLNYVFGKKLSDKLHSTHAGRFETNNTFYRPINAGPVTFTPSAGVIGIFYTNTPQHHSVGQGMFTYGCQANTYLSRRYSAFKHAAEPYINFQGLTHPPATNREHFIFNIDDGYHTLNMLRGGLRQSFYSLKHREFLPDFFIDLYTYAFLGNTAFHRTVPKAYFDFEMRKASIIVRSGVSYNMQQNLFDYTNIGTEWTASEDLALAVEFRHRSKYDWRKADPENFILDVDRPIEELLHTPISDGRDTLLTRIQFRFSPLWTCHIGSHHGWGRKNEPGYNEANVALTTYLSSKWTVTFTYARSADKRNHFDFKFKLIK